MEAAIQQKYKTYQLSIIKYMYMHLDSLLASAKSLSKSESDSESELMTNADIIQSYTGTPCTRATFNKLRHVAHVARDNKHSC